jgi:hypothetical protein
VDRLGLERSSERLVDHAEVALLVGGTDGALVAEPDLEPGGLA